jgi:hypothetical protein
MRAVTILTLLACLGLQTVDASAARRARVVRRGPHRTVVVVRAGHPIRRAHPVVVVRAPRRAVLVTTGAFLAPVLWAPAVVMLPARDRLVWEDSETLLKADDWTDFTLNVNDRGEKLYLELTGKAQLDFAEVVFGNGETQVVDFGEKTYGPGIYSLLDFRDGREVSHVRMIARAKSPETRLIVRMQR